MNTLRTALGVMIGAAALAAACSDHTEAPTVRATTMTAVLDQASTASVVTDPAGDAAWNSNTGPGSAAKVQGYLDIVRAEVSKTAGRFVFTLDLAAPVPADPALDPDLPPQVDHVLFVYGLDTDPTTAPVGYPFNKNEANNQEFYLGAGWNPTGSFGLGTGFIGFVIDRRPLLAGGAAVITPIRFNIQGTRVSVVMDAATLGDPATFAWAAFTHLQERPHPPDNGPILDVAPEVLSGAPLATWPQ